MLKTPFLTEGNRKRENKQTFSSYLTLVIGPVFATGAAATFGATFFASNKFETLISMRNTETL